MFTGIVQHVGRVVDADVSAGGSRLVVDLGPLAEGLGVGASVAVDGACLTVSAMDRGQAVFDVVAETLERTTLGELAAGAPVNLELAARAGAPLDGHIVQGHVDGLCRVASIDRDGPSRFFLNASAAPDMTGQMVVKGSIALAGVSLTLAEVEKERFSVALVPTTLKRTTLGGLRVSDRLNVELDIIGKYVRRHLEGFKHRRGLTIDRLMEEGFA